MASPAFLVVGHVVKDLGGGTYALGGTATYAALTALRHGYATAVLTRAAADLAPDLAAVLPGVEVLRLPAAATTTFRNVYHAGRREQHLVAVADPIEPADVPAAWREAGLVLLGPVAGELRAELVDLFPRSLLGLAAQGWLRRRAPDGRVQPAPWPEAGRALARADVVVLSEEDVGGDRQLVARYAAETRVLVLTEGPRGATIYRGGAATRVSAFPARAVDPTGAGDVFAAAFLITYHETGDPLAAARFANCAASLAVEGRGTAGVPTRAQVLARLAAGADGSTAKAG